MNNCRRNTILTRLSNKVQIENRINENRIKYISKRKTTRGKVVYLISREFRYYDNFALDLAQEFAYEYNLTLEVLFKMPIFEIQGKRKFFNKNLEHTKQDFATNNIKCKAFDNGIEIEKYLKQAQIHSLIIDFNPIEKVDYSFLNANVIEIDGHNIVPARHVSNKQEYSAATLRRKIYAYIYEFLREYKNPIPKTPKALEIFLKKNLDSYAEYKNDPTMQATSKLSPYLNFGFISSQRVALEILKSNTSNTNKEEFLEEIIVRKELSDNFCLHCKNFKTFECILEWAKKTLYEHENDIRPHIYRLEELELGQSPDDLWNAAQKQLTKEGKIEGYLRMYWAKQLLYWCPNPKNALDAAIYLNDKYAYDAPSTNGYVGILWSLGGLHDRAFARRPIFGKIRTMTYAGAKSKFDVSKYIKKYI